MASVKPPFHYIVGPGASPLKVGVGASPLSFGVQGRRPWSGVWGSKIPRI